MENHSGKSGGGKKWIIALLGIMGCFPVILILAGLFGIGIFSSLFHEEELDSEYGGFCQPTGSVNMSAWEMTFSNSAQSGAFVGYGGLIVQLAQEQGIDPILAAAIMLHETGKGTSNAVRNYNNPGGIMDPASGWSRLKRFPSMEEGLRYTMANLKRRIIDDGLNTIEKLGAVYAPIGAANDPNGLNRYWVPRVTELAAKLGGLSMDCEDVVVAGNDKYQAILNEMLKYDGWHYRWGGVSPKTSFDCSGLMMWAFKKAGINLPRTSYEQYKFTKRISKDQLQPGDLIFFKTASYNPVTHVGMYVGNGKMFDANNGGIGYTNPFNSYWGPKIVGYGRVADFSK
ncbi:NlpC/P60 family protein [Pseudobacillus badius]|uniref:C40 family peptidase n=1 Tax=Bacillus badius TaxID=1455 RepID=UPI0005ADA265|nr:NlpC/P60 family protein [Bacillus badius]KIL74703.1 lipoprotein, NLP/P60 family [Bacillus badius]UAT32454.1 C40 family peptidase [Bacillus badius]GLY12707.1 hydrolase [Bacillus badius]